MCSAVFFCMKFDIITIFPEMFDSFLKESIISKARAKNKISIKIHDLRGFSKDKHKKVDDSPFGGGRGMVMMVDPIAKAVKKIKKGRSRVVLFSPRGKKFNQSMANKWSKLDQLVFVCGRYEGIDERVAEHIADEVVSIGDYVLSGGELAAMIIAESVSRLIPGVLGNKESLASETHNLQPTTNNLQLFDFPQYTRPEKFRAGNKIWKVPEVLLSGNHAEIEKWRKEKQGKNLA